MKKLQLTDGLATSETKDTVKKTTYDLTLKIKELCKNEKTSYIEINKALYLADKELYLDLINMNLQ